VRRSRDSARLARDTFATMADVRRILGELADDVGVRDHR
jgi:hypothetical protein